jgi:hypothetical protein
VDHGVEGRVARLNAVDRRGAHLVARDLLFADQPGEPERIVLFVSGESGHGRLLLE